MSTHPGEGLSEWLDGRLPPAEATAVARHLDICVACRAEVEDLRALRTLLRTTATPPPRETFWAHLDGGIADERARLQRRWWWRRVLIPAALTALATAALALTPVPEVPLNIAGYVHEHAQYRSLHPLNDAAAVILVGTDATLRLEEPWLRADGLGP